MACARSSCVKLSWVAERVGMGRLGLGWWRGGGLEGVGILVCGSELSVWSRNVAEDVEVGFQRVLGLLCCEGMLWRDRAMRSGRCGRVYMYLLA